MAAIYTAGILSETDGEPDAGGATALPGPVRIRAQEPTRVVLIGGEPLDQRQIWWNFVHTEPDRIEQARRDWSAGRFPVVPGDQEEFIALPDA